MKFNKKIVWISVIAVALALGGIYIASRQNAITHVIGDNNFEGSEKEWCDSLLDKLVVIDKKNCQIGKQKISQYSLTKKKYYANVSQEEMIRELIRRGLAVADKDTREQIHASLQ